MTAARWGIGSASIRADRSSIPASVGYEGRITFQKH